LNSLLQILTQSFGNILQNHLFPVLRAELDVMSERHEQFVRALVVLQLDGFVSARKGRGRPAHDRANIARAFVAKAVFNFPHTRALVDRLRVDAVLRRLCGWETVAQVPDETVFSRAFAEFAVSEFPQQVHAGLIQRTQSERLIGHISRDSTAIEAREKAQPKPKRDPKAPPIRRSHHKTKQPKSPEQMTRLDRQCSGTMTVEQMLAELPRAGGGAQANRPRRQPFRWHVPATVPSGDRTQLDYRNRMITRRKPGRVIDAEVVNGSRPRSNHRRHDPKRLR